MTDRCYICGTEVKETTYGRKYCPNCGVIDEEKEAETEEIPNYV